MAPISIVPGLKYIIYGLLILVNGFVLVFLSSYLNMILLKTLGTLAFIVSVFPFILGGYLYLHYKMFGPSYIQKVSNETFQDIVVRCMLAIAMYNKVPGNVDAYRIKRIYKIVFDYEPADVFIYKTSENMYSNGFNLNNFLRNKFRFIEKPLRINVFKACYLLCHNNKNISEEQEKVLFHIARLLSLNPNHMKTAIREVDLGKYEGV